LNKSKLDEEAIYYKLEQVKSEFRKMKKIPRPADFAFEIQKEIKEENENLHAVSEF
jgi:hypothetical protein